MKREVFIFVFVLFAFSLSYSQSSFEKKIKIPSEEIPSAMFSAIDSNLYIQDEIISSERCREGYDEDTINVVTQDGAKTRYHCVKRSAFRTGESFITNSYIKINSLCEDRNNDGNMDVSSSFNAYNSNDELITVSLCIASSQGSLANELILRSALTFASNLCPSGSAQEGATFKDADKKTLKHCIERAQNPSAPKPSTSQRGNPITLAAYYNNHNGVLYYDGTRYEFCQTSLRDNCEAVDTNLIPDLIYHVLDTATPTESIIEDSNPESKINYPCTDMNEGDSLTIAKINIQETSQKFLAVGLYIPKDWFILDETLKVIEGNIQIFSYNPITQEIILSSRELSQETMSGELSFLIVKPEGFAQDTMLGSYSTAFTSEDGTLDFRFREMQGSSRGSCSCWRTGSRINLNDVMDNYIAFASGFSC